MGKKERIRRERLEVAERLQLAKQFLQQRSAMVRVALTPAEWLAFKLGCTYEEAERLVELVKEDVNVAQDA